MGRKGVSKRKPKQTKQSSTPVSGTNSGRSSGKNGRQVEGQPLQVTEKSKASPILGNEIKPSTGSDKERKKR
ncbi:MAG: hypothetical protein A2W35_10015 [Chloroflexi bacterium RBG_16_57_11]|nr:MAG: hypothetical protein A2W35_10015 [Chloroflexi bacterium RBG_16_57_11]